MERSIGSERQLLTVTALNAMCGEDSKIAERAVRRFRNSSTRGIGTERQKRGSGEQF